MRLLILFASVLTSTRCASAPSPRPTLAQRISAIADAPPFHRALWAIDVEQDDGTALFARNAELLVVPASNRKLFSASLIADCLGDDSRLTTTVWLSGEDLILEGHGDPSLGSWRYERDGDFDRVAALLRARGVTAVRDLVADVSAFDRVTVPPGWKVGYLTAPYGAPVDAIAWNENGVAGHAVSDPAAFALAALRDALVLNDVPVTGVDRVAAQPAAGGTRVAELPSPFSAQLLSTVLQNSQNLYAEMLFKAAGGGTYEGALAAEAAFLDRSAALPEDGYRFVDGCGLAPDDLVTSKAVVGMLRWMNEPQRRPFWWSVLAAPGSDGTLHRRLTPLAGRLRGKTGTIEGVNALSGIVAMPDGHWRYFSIILNHYTGEESATAAIDAIASAIAE